MKDGRRGMNAGSVGVGSEHKRTHVLLPAELIGEIDRRVGARRRSAFLAEAARHELRRRDQLASLEAFAGYLKEVDVPGWGSPEAASAWVRQQRRSGCAADVANPAADE
jgi:hypothetical protein